MNIKLFFIACITSLTSFSNISHSLNDMYVDETKIKDCFNTIESLANNYIKHISLDFTRTDQLLLISNTLFMKQASLFNSINTLKQIMNYSDEIINKFISNARKNSDVKLYSNYTTSCDEQINMQYILNIQKEYDKNNNIIKVDPDNLLGFYLKYDEEELIAPRILQLNNKALKLRVTNIVKDILEGISNVAYYKKCFESCLNNQFINILNSINTQEFNETKNQINICIDNISKNKEELFNDISQYCKINQYLSAQELHDSVIKIIIEHKDEIIACNPDQIIPSVPIFGQNGNSYINEIKQHNINSIKLLHYLKELNLDFLYNRKSINNMKSIIDNNNKYNTLKDKIINKILPIKKYK